MGSIPQYNHHSFIHINLLDYIGHILDLLVKILDILRTIPTIDLAIDHRQLITHFRIRQQIPV